METKIYSSSGFAHTCSAEELYVLTRHWMFDIVFFEQELQFLQSFMLQCFLQEAQGVIDQMDNIDIEFTNLSIRLKRLKETIHTHQAKLADILDKTVNSEPLDYNVAQFKVEGELFDFIKTFRHVKQELFKLYSKVNSKL